MATKIITFERNKKRAQKKAKEFTEKTGWQAYVGADMDSRGTYYAVHYDNLCSHGWHGGCPKGCHDSLQEWYEEQYYAYGM